MLSAICHCRTGISAIDLNLSLRDAVTVHQINALPGSAAYGVFQKMVDDSELTWVATDVNQDPRSAGAEDIRMRVSGGPRARTRV